MTTRAPLNSSIRILIVDDHELLRDGLRDLIHAQADWRVCGEATNENDGLQQFRQCSPDLVIVDLALQDGNGLELIKRIVQKSPEARILVLSMHDEKLYAERALRAGAAGFVSKQQSSSEILGAIRTVLEGGLYLSSRLSAELLDRLRAPQNQLQKPAAEQLSDRELEIFGLIGRGLTTDQIARRLHLSPNTIGTYRERLKTKLNANCANELIRLASQWVMQNG